ncbi:YxD-tail cyclophane-containing RiPP peptide [Streptomyces sp. NPDC003077]|uniref:YxD-tail cyclophane-containing RiPP peptide n=1 Tax=Streptomyces sp. NPDC003077 TaxID=3154443 RepID=UPI0033B157AB
MATTPLTGPAPAAGPSAEPLPDFGAVDVAAVAARTAHPVLGEVAALLLRDWPDARDAVAYYEDGPEAVGTWAPSDGGGAPRGGPQR